MENIKILCINIKKEDEFEENSIVYDVYAKIKEKVEITDENVKYKTYEDYGLVEQDEEETEILEVESNFKYMGERYSMTLSKSTFSNDNAILYVDVDFIEDTVRVDETGVIISLYDFKIKLKNVLGKLYQEVHWQKDTQNESLSTKLYSKVHNIENRFREIINEYMIRVYGVGWFKNNIHSDYYKKYEDFSKWFRKSKYHTFKNIKTELFNLQITDLIEMLKESYPEEYVNKVNSSINTIRNILKDKADQVLKEDVLGLTSIWEKEKFSNIFGEDIETIWESFSNMRNMIAHNKPICKELFEDICNNVSDLEARFEQSERILNRKIKSNEEILRMKFYDDQMDRFYLQDCDLEELPDEEEIIERITDNEDIITLFNSFEEYKSEFSSYVEEILGYFSEVFDYIDLSDIEDAKEKLNLLNEVLHYDNKYEKCRFEKYINAMHDQQGLELIKEDFEDIIENMTHQFEEVTEKIEYDDISDFQEGVIAKLANIEGQNLEVEIVDWFCPERGSSDTIHVKVRYRGKEEARGIIEKSYGDYEILDDTYPMPTHSDDLYINIDEVNEYLDGFKNNNCGILEELRDQLYTICS
ncbi:hypothetical protein UT300018_27810 [Clostridium faecium]|uniref:Swt1-like HEPN domain-containing protein n=1 Tax=Clostridium faecium TaxID=2762223 RepID=A0ABR8YUP3_9CLOT|nr:hypothetical protein [Clostridium faecium]MBD8047960.1 hypothetical protein [Clostridium faecium]